MLSDPMNRTQTVRREDLFREPARDENGNIIKDGKGSDETAAAAQAELDAYMKSMLGLHFDIPEPQAAAKSSIPAPTPSKASKASKPARKDTKNNGSDVDMDSSDDEDEPESEAQKPQEPTATEFAFRMFTGSGKVEASTTSQPVVLLDDNADGTQLGPGAIMEPRPEGFYMARGLSQEDRLGYAQAAIAGDDIIAQSNPSIRNTRGLEVPWRVRTLKAGPRALRALLTNALAPGQPAPTNLPVALAAAINALPAWAGGSPPQNLPETQPGRKRPGKKQRIILRQREKARREKEAAEAAKAQSKEEQLSEKKKRLNRIKKLRRRAQAKAGKAGGSEAGGEGENESGGE